MKKYFFSLMELIVCFSILAMVVSTLSFWVIKRIEKERFYSDIKRFERTVSFCQKVAKIRQEDVFCTLEKTLSGVKYEIENFSLPKEKNLITNSNMQVGGKKIDKFKIEFTLNGGIYPNEKIYFYSKNDKYIKELNLNIYERY